MSGVSEADVRRMIEALQQVGRIMSQQADDFRASLERLQASLRAASSAPHQSPRD